MEPTGWLKRTLLPTRQEQGSEPSTVFQPRRPVISSLGSGTTAEGFTAQSIIGLLGILAAFEPGLRGRLPSEEKEIQDKDPIGQLDRAVIVRIGGITAGKQVADEAARRGVTFVNHTFTTQLALSASLQPFAGLENHRLCEYPAAPTSLGRDLTTTRLTPNSAGELELSNSPGLGVEPDLEVIRKYLRDIEISADGKVLYRTPSVYG